MELVNKIMSTIRSLSSVNRTKTIEFNGGYIKFKLSTPISVFENPHKSYELVVINQFNISKTIFIGKHEFIYDDKMGFKVNPIIISNLSHIIYDLVV